MKRMEHSVRIGLLRLADAAPAIVGAEWGVFARHGLDVALSVEPSWANVADKLSYGLLDAAVMLPPLAMAMAAGLREPRTRLLVPMGLSRGGNSVVLSAPAAAAVAGRLDGTGDPAPDGLSAGGLSAGGLDALGPDAHGLDARGLDARGRALAGWARSGAERGAPPRLGVVHLFSPHNLLLRHWLAEHGAVPERDAVLVVLPPAEMGTALAEGRIDGFCAGAPWGVAAERHGGRVIARGSELRPGGVEKVLAVRADWADAEPDRLRALTLALRDAARLCDDPARGGALAALLAREEHVGVDAGMIRPFLSGGAAAAPLDPIRFADALLPDAADANWFAAAMGRWGWLPEAERNAAEAVYRPDLARALLDGPA